MRFKTQSLFLLKLDFLAFFSIFYRFCSILLIIYMLIYFELSIIYGVNYIGSKFFIEFSIFFFYFVFIFHILYGRLKFLLKFDQIFNLVSNNLQNIKKWYILIFFLIFVITCFMCIFCEFIIPCCITKASNNNNFFFFKNIFTCLIFLIYIKYKILNAYKNNIFVFVNIYYFYLSIINLINVFWKHFYYKFKHKHKLTYYKSITNNEIKKLKEKQFILFLSNNYENLFANLICETALENTLIEMQQLLKKKDYLLYYATLIEIYIFIHQRYIKLLKLFIEEISGTQKNFLLLSIFYNEFKK